MSYTCSRFIQYLFIVAFGSIMQYSSELSSKLSKHKIANQHTGVSPKHGEAHYTGNNCKLAFLKLSVFDYVALNKCYCIVLYCIVLYCIVLYCIVLYCIVLYCIVSYYIPPDINPYVPNGIQWTIPQLDKLLN